MLACQNVAHNGLWQICAVTRDRMGHTPKFTVCGDLIHNLLYFLTHFRKRKVCNGRSDCPQTETERGGEDEENCEGEFIETK